MTFGQGKDAARFHTARLRGPRSRAIWVWPALAVLLVVVDSLAQHPIVCENKKTGSSIRLTSTMSLDSIDGPAGLCAADPENGWFDRDLLWEFSQPGGATLLVRLPLVSVPSDQLPDMAHPAFAPSKRWRQMVTLLPPQPIESVGPSTESGTIADAARTADRDTTEAPTGEAASLGDPPEATGAGPMSREVPEGRRPGQTVPEQTAPAPVETGRIEPVQFSDEAVALATGARTGAKVNELAMAKIDHGRRLAERGAYFAARQEFLQVLRMLACAKDVNQNDPIHLQALAKGLRAMDEAEDFLPRGTALEANIDVGMISSSHRTTIALTSRESEESRVRRLQGGAFGFLMPQQCIGRYFQHAQLHLSEAVAGEPSGSMALHALGKVTLRQALLEPERHPLAHRRAFTYQQAALLAHGQNHLAAHELGVLLADSGHYAEAQRLLLEVAFRQPHPTVFRNLAKVQRKLGNPELAEANMRQAEEQAHRSGEQDRLVQWISPSEFAQTGDATRGPPHPLAVASTQPPKTSAPPGLKSSGFWSWPWSRGQSDDPEPLHAAKAAETRPVPAKSANTPSTYH